MTYFKELPLIDYNKTLSKNIILKSAILKDVIQKASVFYSYVIQEGYRPDMVANEEYGNPQYDWIVYLSNNIIDPYYNWPMDYKMFAGYLEAKYGTDVYTLQSQILHYKYTGTTDQSPEEIAMISWTMTPETHAILAADDPTSVTGWSPVYVYDYEDDQNDSRRSIQLISKVYIPQIENELTKIFKQ